MIFLRVVFAVLALVSAGCAVKGATYKRRNIGYVVVAAIIAVSDVFYIFLVGISNAKEAAKVLLPFYILNAWFLIAIMWMIICIDRIKKYYLFAIVPLICSLYQTYLVISQYLGARIFSFQKRIYFRKAFWVAVDTKNTGLLFSYRSYRIATYIKLFFIILLLIFSVKSSQKIFRARYNAVILMMAGYSIAISIMVRFLIPVWIPGVLYTLISVFGLYYLNIFQKRRLKEWSLDSFANDMSDGLILYDKYNDPIHANDMIRTTLDPGLVQEFMDRNRLEEWIEENRIDDYGGVMTYTNGEGEELYFKVTKRDIGDKHSTVGTLYILHDTTDSVNRIRSVEKTNEELERVSRMKSDFLANMSHEIRTPMNAVIGMTELAIREKDTPDLTDYLLQIQNSGKNLLNIINDILDYSKIESGKMEIIEDEYDPFEELNEIARILFTRVGEKPLEFFIVVESELPKKLIGDAMRIRQILINLANNAIKFSKEGMVTVRVSCETMPDNMINMVYHVIDTGIGIKKEDQDKLFVSFSQVDSRRNRSVEGTGLGLAISQRLVEAMNGDIGFESEYGKGSDFWFSVPLKVADPANSLVVEDAADKHAFVYDKPNPMADIFIGDMNRFGVGGSILEDTDDYKPTGKMDHLFFLQDSYDEKIKTFLKDHPDVTGVIRLEYASDFEPDLPNLKIMRKPMTTMVMVNVLNGRFKEVRKIDEKKAYKADFTAPDARILVVDDNEINLTIAEGLLTPIKAKVDKAGGGREAIEKVRTGDYDIVFMDHMMPEIDGVDATKEIRSVDGFEEKPVIIALSANVMEEAKKLFKESGMNDFVPKPVDVRVITEAVKKWLPEEKIILRSGDEAGDDAAGDLIKCEGLEYEKAAEALGSAALYNKVLEEYYRSGPDKLARLLDDVAKSDWEDYTIKVHALKSSSRQIGAIKLGDMAEALEKAGKAGDTDKIIKDNPAAMDAYRAILDSLKGVFPEEEEKGDKPLMDEETLKESLTELEKACEDLDLDDMEKVANRIKEHSFEDDIKEEMDKLRKAIADVDVEGITEIVEKIRNGRMK